jgi:hypothetical protein
MECYRFKKSDCEIDPECSRIRNCVPYCRLYAEHILMPAIYAPLCCELRRRHFAARAQTQAPKIPRAAPDAQRLVMLFSVDKKIREHR